MPRASIPSSPVGNGGTLSTYMEARTKRDAEKEIPRHSRKPSAAGRLRDCEVADFPRRGFVGRKIAVEAETGELPREVHSVGHHAGRIVVHVELAADIFDGPYPPYHEALRELAPAS